MKSLHEEPTLEAAKMFQALNHDVRFVLVDDLLKNGRQSFTELSTKVDISKTAMSYHLQILVLSGLLEKSMERKGAEYVFYDVTKIALDLFRQLDLLIESEK